MRIAPLLLAFVSLASTLAASKRTSADSLDLPPPLQRPVQYFGDIHPVLAQHCVSCHGAEKQKGGLRLDSREMALKGGESFGPAIVPGMSAKSPLLLFMAHLEPDMEMPPKKKEKLSDDTLSLVRTWIDQGAEWPTIGPKGTAASLGNQELFFKKAATHWSFQPVPKADSNSLAQGPSTIDLLIGSVRSTKGLEAAPRADAPTLLKRLHFDLTGLPPSPEEMDRFLSDFTQDAGSAISNKVDELLASPHFGERWGRFWLDIARYADAQDLFPGVDLRYPFAWTYRDYVIGAFNNDTPYDRFIREQIAADLLARSPDDPTLAALGLLTVGPRFLRKQDEQINDRIDVVTRGIMGLTVACARCHDHKFDPIPTTDFYALYGVFQSSIIPEALPQISLPNAKSDPALRSAYTAAIAETQAALDQLNARERDKAVADLLARPEEHFEAFCDVEYGKKPLNSILNTTSLSNVALAALTDRKKSAKNNAPKISDPILAPLAKVLACPANQQTETLRIMLESGLIPGTQEIIHPQVLAILREKKPDTEEALMRAYGSVLAAAKSTNPEDAMSKGLREALIAKGGLLDFPPAEIERTASTTVSARAEYRKLRSELAEIENTHAGAPTRAMVLNDLPKPIQPVVFIRGQPANRGESVARRFLQLLDPKMTPFSPTQSGRKELADHITHPSNPLTPRVWANQVWRHLLGSPLVRTTSDFGLQAEPPSHPQLLDWLASALIERGWSTKKLVRDIVLSTTYQQSSADRPDGRDKDPDNTWLWRANRRRLDVESMRDAMLAASGRLDPTLGGRAVALSAKPFTRRRTVYGFVDRVQLEPMFSTFDFPAPDTANTERAQTNVPQQALFALNDAFIIDQARAIAAQAESSATQATNPAPVEAIRAIYRQVHQREPSAHESELAQRMLASVSKNIPPQLTGAWQFGFGNANPSLSRAQAFHPFGHFDAQARRYQGSSTYPDRARHGFAAVTETGGHPGDGIDMASIRRWTAPHDGTFSIAGDLSVSAKGTGDGVRARVISSRNGLLGEWILDRVNLSSSPTVLPMLKISAGETLDFTVDCRETTSGDGYRWGPVIRSLRPPEEAPKGMQTVWDAQADFKAPPPPKLSPLQQIAQALLMTNEFMFID